MMITGQHVWSLGVKKGASSFYHTLRGYTDHGYQIEQGKREYIRSDRE